MTDSQFNLSCTTNGKESDGPFPWHQHQHCGEEPVGSNGAQRSMSSDCTTAAVLHVRSTALGPRNPRAPAGSQSNVCPRYLEDEELRNLDRTVEVFKKIEMEEHMSFTLPKPASTAGYVLAHACSSFESLHSKHNPMTFKFGITHCAHFRWHHRPYGYRHGVEKFTHMVILYASSNPYGPAFLEASLIQRYGSFSA